jgi:hypothetical protein
MAIGARLTAPYSANFDPTHRFVTSWILSPGLLFGLRALLSLYAFTTLFTIFGWNGSHGMSDQSRLIFIFHAFDLLGSCVLLRIRRHSYRQLLVAWNSFSVQVAESATSGTQHLLLYNRSIPIHRDQ